jgi:RNA ligase
MQLDKYLDMEDLQRQIEQGMIVCRTHPSDNLAILNYTAKAQYTPELWTETTDKCRGLIYNVETNEIQARPFVKFWNYADSRHPETLPGTFPASVPTMTRKMDGSLGIGYWSGYRFQVATRGSFESEQAKWATEWVAKHQPPFPVPGFTFLFEIIYPENQIVVRYDWQGLVLLAVVNNETGVEEGREYLESIALDFGWRVVDAFDKNLMQCVEEDGENEEGYVAAWPREGTWPLRVKIKYATYCRLHKLLTQTSPKSIWEILRDGRDEELEQAKQDAPEDFVRWVTEIESTLRNDFKIIEQTALAAMLDYPDEKNITTPEQRKQFALYAIAKKPVTPILFAMLDSKDYAPIIWKMVKPQAEKVFKIDEEG